GILSHRLVTGSHTEGYVVVATEMSCNAVMPMARRTCSRKSGHGKPTEIVPGGTVRCSAKVALQRFGRYPSKWVRIPSALRSPQRTNCVQLTAAISHQTDQPQLKS